MTPHYARLVLEAATFRRIERCGTRITQIGRGQRGTPDDAFDVVATTWRELGDARHRWQASWSSGQTRDAADRSRLVAGHDNEPSEPATRVR
jgi:hypothetical protein